MTSDPRRRAARHCHNVLNPFHSTHYFSPDLGKELAAIGVSDSSAAYLAARSAPMGAVGAGTVTATFYNFKHDLVARHVPAVWETASPEAVLAARARAVDSTLRRLLGAEALASKEMAEAAELALRAAEACTRHARPLYAAHADLDVPEEPHMAYWHATTLLREHRGDGHIGALLGAELDPVEALVSHVATGKGMAPKWLLATRGWDRAEYDAAADRLRARGLLTADEELTLTEQGVTLRAEIEHRTDALDRAPYEHLGEAGVARLTELATTFIGAALGNGAFPADLIGKAA
ncbi:SCO6745 family protein [Streptomyces sp. BH106]|uniref:SCO6745 family protein n=1 Tax=Streptomyces sp. BH106 TaxID=3410409 RepID=UPI003CED0AD6